MKKEILLKFQKIILGVIILVIVLILSIFAIPILYLSKKFKKCQYCKKRGKISYEEKYYNTFIPVCQNCLNFKNKNVRRKVIIDDIVN